MALALAIVPSAAMGQANQAAQSGRIAGRVSNSSTAAPVEGALLALLSLNRSTLSNEEGGFTIAEVEPGGHQLRASHLAFGTEEIIIQVVAGQTTFIELALEPEAVVLDPLDVRIEWRPHYLEVTGYYERMRLGLGRFFDPSWVDTRNVGFTRANQFVEYVKGQSPALTCAETPVYLDRRRILNQAGRGDGNNLLAELSSSSVGAVEVYSTGHGIPTFALNDTTIVCGAVIMWSARSGGSEAPQLLVELCETSETYEHPFTLEGVVRDDLTGVPLPAAILTVSVVDGRGERTVVAARSNREGRYRVCDLIAGDVLSIVASYARETSETVSVNLHGAPESTVRRDMRIRVSRPALLEGRVVDADTRRPVRQAEVTLQGESARTTTDQRGFFMLRDVRPGDHVIIVRHRSYAQHSDSLVVRSGKNPDLRVEMRPNGVSADVPDVSASVTNYSGSCGGRIRWCRRSPHFAALETSGFTHGHSESFDSRFRDEFLDRELFVSLTEAKDVGWLVPETVWFGWSTRMS